jgi:hypothetical protein
MYLIPERLHSHNPEEMCVEFWMDYSVDILQDISLNEFSKEKIFMPCHFSCARYCRTSDVSSSVVNDAPRDGLLFKQLTTGPKESEPFPRLWLTYKDGKRIILK